MNEEPAQPVISNIPKPVKAFNTETVLMVGSAALLLGGILGYVTYPLVHGSENMEIAQRGEDATVADEQDAPQPTPDTAPIENLEVSLETEIGDSPTTVESTPVLAEEYPFCKEYGAAVISKKDLLETYTIGPGETLRDVATKVLNDETKALELITANPQLARYEIDDPLPMGLEIYIPNDKYTKEGITSYIRARGNITFNETKPMFGVTAPNSGTGPFIISDDIKADMKGIMQGDCVVVIYGSMGYDPNKIVLEVRAQE